MTEPLLFSPLTLRGVTTRNRVVISPMCQYSAVDGVVQDWHFVHLGRFALGGAGIVFVEATGVEPEGRISHGCTGLWNDAQQQALGPIAAFLKSQGAVPAIQLAHAGRKASAQRPWQGAGPITAENALPGEEPWPVVGPSPIVFDDGWQVPRELTIADIERLTAAWAASAKRALAAGFEIVEVHAAHGYLLSEFLSPASNHRTDAYGGDRAGRMRFPLEVVEAVRAVWPADKPLFVRVNGVDGTADGWGIEDTVAFAAELKARGVDVVDCSAGGVTTDLVGIRYKEPGYQVPFAEAVRKGAGVASMTVGLINDPHQAEAILKEGRADLVCLARTALDDPNWAQHARSALVPEKAGDSTWPPQAGYAIRRLYRLIGKL